MLDTLCAAVLVALPQAHPRILYIVSAQQLSRRFPFSFLSLLDLQLVGPQQGISAVIGNKPRDPLQGKHKE